MSLSSQGCRESKPPVKGCGVVPTALLLFQQLGRFMSKYFNLGREIVGLVSEGNLRENVFEVSHHRVITSSTLAGQYSSFKAFFHCQWKGKMAHQFFYYNMLLNLTTLPAVRSRAKVGSVSGVPYNFYHVRLCLGGKEFVDVADGNNALSNIERAALPPKIDDAVAYA